MKILSLTLGATLLAGASASFDYTATPTGQDKCALINVVMDESGSMNTDQAFMRTTALPRMGEELRGPNYSYDHVFLCSTGFNNYNGARWEEQTTFAKAYGCTIINEFGVIEDPAVVAWQSGGVAEDGWYAMMTAMKDVPSAINNKDLLATCNQIDKNLILVTDEDRDNHSQNTFAQVKNQISLNGYILNCIINIIIDKTFSNLGMKIAANRTQGLIFSFDSTTGTAGNTTRNGLYTNYVIDYRTTNEDYSEMVVGTDGAIWNINSLRNGGTITQAFADAFVAVKVQEISSGCALCQEASTGTLAPVVAASMAPSVSPSVAASASPSVSPSVAASVSPSASPSLSPVVAASASPSVSPVVAASASPSVSPVVAASASPSVSPVVAASASPSVSPVVAASASPSVSPPVAPVNPPTGTNGDPHFKTWKHEHFEFHGQCDMILAKDLKFANGVGLDVQIRTKMVRFWSYIHTAAIRIGDDILEIQGSVGDEERDTHYWFNFQYQAEATTVGGFPLTITSNGAHKRYLEIDLGSKFPGQKILLSVFKEFVAVDFKDSTAESFGNTVGMLGDYKSGKTFARDGVTEVHDFNELGNEWQLLPSDDMLFHDKAEPQYPKRCILPEDPQGQRRRRLDESSISVEQAEAICATLKDPLSIKDCVYDILATQDLDMVGAF